ncbi:MAG: hypothetical protein KUG69_15250 [Marinosulfonomonas sp.]|nr:hypothetical protein [Marinosulfonomonas sp.]
MTVDQMISGLGNNPMQTIKVRLANANRVLARDPTNADARRLRGAIEEELTRRRLANRRKVGALWWEPHDPDFPEFFAYETAESTVPVAAIFKRDMHTATRKDVYSLRIGDLDLPGEFSEIEIARRAGSDAWGKINGRR